jgi:hypothetical protein
MPSAEAAAMAVINSRNMTISKMACNLSYEPFQIPAFAKLIDWLDELTAECPKKVAHNMNDPCSARCRDLAKVL